MTADTPGGDFEKVDLGALLVKRTETDEKTIVADFGAAIMKRLAPRISDFAGKPLCDNLAGSAQEGRGTASVVRLGVTGTSEPFYILVTSTLLGRISAAIFNAEDKEVYAAEPQVRSEITQLDRAVADRTIAVLSEEVAALLARTGTYEIKGRDGNISRLPLDFFHLPVTHVRASLAHRSVEGGGPELEVLCPRQVAAALVQTSMKPRAADAAAWRRGLYEAALEIPLTVDANIARLTLPMNRLSGLAAGSELPINAADVANLEVQGTKLAAAEAGDQNGQKAVRIMAFENGQNLVPTGK